MFVRDSSGPAAALDLDLAGEVPRGSEPFEAPDELVILESADDPLARTDEYQVPDFGAELELEPSTPDVLAATKVTELEPSELNELEFAPRAPGHPAAQPAEPAAAAQRTTPSWSPLPTDDELAAAAPARDAGGSAQPGTRHGLRRAAAIAAAAVLGLGLLAQIVHYDRDALAESTLVGPSLAALYARLGVPLEPRWNLAAYDVRQWGAQSEETAGVLRLRASIVNRAPRAQPFPLLRVTLEDRFGGQVGRREFTPAEYLPGHATPRELLGAGARADADLSLADPGNQAVGFELDVCLPRHGALACGADAKAGGG